MNTAHGLALAPTSMRAHANCRTPPLCTFFVVLYANFCIRDVS